MKSDKNTRIFLFGIPVLFLFGAFFHFLYDLSGNMLAVGLFAPVNESVFEHLKLFPLPAAIWYTAVYFIKKSKLYAGAWFLAVLAAIAAQAACMVLLYYFYTGAFGLFSLIADIVTFFVSVALGQAAALYCCKHNLKIPVRIPLLLIFAFFACIVFLTLYPPALPIFLDPVTNTYGIPV